MIKYFSSLKSITMTADQWEAIGALVERLRGENAYLKEENNKLLEQLSRSDDNG